MVSGTVKNEGSESYIERRQEGGRQTESVNRRRIACNYREGTKTAGEGSLAYVILTNPGNGADRICILSRSRGGRWIEKWEAIWRLANFRAKTVVPEQSVYGDLAYAAEAEQGCIETLNAVATMEYAKRQLPMKCT